MATPPPPPPDARAFVATAAVTINAQTPYKMDVPIRLVIETLLPPRFILVSPYSSFVAGLFVSPRGVRDAENQRRRRPPRAPVRARYATGSTESRGSTSASADAPVTPAAPTVREPTGRPLSLRTMLNWPGPCAVNGTS